MRSKHYDPNYIPSEFEIFSFSGKFEELHDRSQDVWIEITHKRSEPSEIQCRLLFSPPWDQSEIIPYLQGRNLTISLESPYQGRLYLKMIVGGRYGRNQATFTINSYDIVPLNPEISGGAKVKAIVDLTRCRLIETNSRPFFPWQADEQKDDNTTIAWTAGEASHRFVTLSARIPVVAGQDRGHLTIQRPCLVKTFVTAEATDLVTIMDYIETELNDSLRLLSFLSREWVDWFKMSVRVEWAKEDRQYSTECTRRTEIWENYPADNREEPLLCESDLLDGEFFRLLSALRSSPINQHLRRTIAYSLSSRHGPRDESHFLLAFAAFETLINVLDEQNPLLRIEDIDWNALCKSLKKTIDAHGKAHELADEQVVLIKRKLSELKRPPVIDKMIFHLARLAPETGDLWQDPVSLKDQFIEGLSEAIRQRNVLVHATSVNDFGNLRRDLARIQLLFERLVLGILGCTRSVSSRALDIVRWQEEQLRRGEEQPD
jgi:hypothetical protein